MQGRYHEHMNKALSLTIRRHGSTAFHGRQSIVLDDLRVDSFSRTPGVSVSRPDAIVVLTSAYVEDFSGKAHHDYEINVPMELDLILLITPHGDRKPPQQPPVPRGQVLSLPLMGIGNHVGRVL